MLLRISGLGGERDRRPEQVHLQPLLPVAGGSRERDAGRQDQAPVLHRRARHRRLRDLRLQRLRAAVHQLHEREAAAVLQPPHVRAGAGGVQEGGHRVGDDELRHGSAGVHRPDREAHGHLLHPGGGVHCAEGQRQDVPGEVVQHALGQAPQLRQAQAPEGQGGGSLRHAPLRRLRRLLGHGLAGEEQGIVGQPTK